MTTLIDSTGIVADQWVLFQGDAAGLPRGANMLLPVEEWVERTALWRDHAARIGVLIGPADDARRLHPWLAELALVAVDFPSPDNARSADQAKVLRLLDYAGPIRAMGAIAAGQAIELARAGFDEFEMPDTAQATLALRRLRSAAPNSRVRHGAGVSYITRASRPVAIIDGRQARSDKCQPVEV